MARIIPTLPERPSHTKSGPRDGLRICALPCVFVYFAVCLTDSGTPAGLAHGEVHSAPDSDACRLRGSGQHGGGAVQVHARRPLQREAQELEHEVHGGRRRRPAAQPRGPRRGPLPP